MTNSRGKIRADIVHRRITAMGFTGGERTTRRAVSDVKAALRAGQRRVYRPWIAEPGLWMQWDCGEGPRIGGRRTSLWCVWLSWSRFRVVIPVFDKTLPTIVACLDATLRRIGGVPAYALTDNEKTVTATHIANIAVRNPDIVEVGRHYGMTIRTWLPADPESKGGSEATVRIAKADLVPTDANLLDQYATFGQLEAACRQFCDDVNDRVHRETRRKPAEMLLEERARLHRLPKEPFTVAFGTTRRVCWDVTISVEGVRYSVPHELIDTRVWARFHGDELNLGRGGRPGRGRPPSAVHPGQPGDRRRALPAAREQGERPQAAGEPRGEGSLPRARASGGILADRGRRRRRPTGQAEDGRGCRAGQAPLGRRRRPGARLGSDRRAVRGERPDPHPDLPSRSGRHRTDPGLRRAQPAAGHFRLVQTRPRR